MTVIVHPRGGPMSELHFRQPIKPHLKRSVTQCLTMLCANAPILLKYRRQILGKLLSIAFSETWLIFANTTNRLQDDESEPKNVKLQIDWKKSGYLGETLTKSTDPILVVRFFISIGSVPGSETSFAKNTSAIPSAHRLGPRTESSL